MNILLERDIVRRLKKQCASNEWQLRKLRYEGRKGAPDWLILGTGMHCFVECKAPGKRAKVGQKEELLTLLRAGCFANEVSSLDEVDALVQVLQREKAL